MPEKVLKDPILASDFDACQLKRSQRHKSSIKLRPWLPDYCTGEFLVVAGVHDDDDVAKSPRSFDGSDSLHRSVQDSLRKFTWLQNPALSAPD